MKGYKRILLLLLPVVLIISCNSAKEKQVEKDTTAPVITTPGAKPDSVAIKTSWAIDKYARQDLQVGGYKLLSLEIDSLSYKMVSLKDYYTQRIATIKKEKEEYRKVNTRLKQSGVAVNQSKLTEDSVKTANALRVLEELINKSDNEKNIICATYKLVAQTNTTAYNTVYTKYLFAKDFTEVKMKFQDVQH